MREKVILGIDSLKRPLYLWKKNLFPSFPSLIFRGYDMLVSGRLLSKFVKIHHQNYSCLPSGKLTWQWKILVLCRKYIFQWSISYCYVRLPECKSGIRILVDPSLSNRGAEKFPHRINRQGAWDLLHRELKRFPHWSYTSEYPQVKLGRVGWVGYTPVI